jgi:formyltetrahydrofolate deformylase
MHVTITAVGPDNRGLADPIVHYVATAGANIHEIQMYDHDSERLFAMLLRVDWPHDDEPIADLRRRMQEIGRLKGLTVRTWSRDEHARPPRLAICTTYRPRTGARDPQRHPRSAAQCDGRRYGRKPRRLPQRGGAVRRPL